MTKDESKREILKQWARYRPDPNRAEYHDKLKFYDWLKDAYPELLQWGPGTETDRWQEMQSWLNEKSD
ncbi:MAG: hypothetical protein ACXWYD_11770 [Candidatus Binatia bacterium]